MSLRVDIQPELLVWACERSRKDVDTLSAKFPKLPEWLTGETKPTLKQLEGFAHATHTPVGYLFLQKPPYEEVPIPDMRTMRNEALRRPSPDLLDTVYTCQLRQDWYRDYLRAEGHGPLSFVGTAGLRDDPSEVAARMRSALGFEVDERKAMSTWTDALRRFIEQAEALGVLVMVNGVVGSNTSRKLDPEEFRGFALADTLAPLVFVNGADSKSAQMFTLAHELAHIWLGDSALSDVSAQLASEKTAERWCNAVAAELLVPLAALHRELPDPRSWESQVQRLARCFKVSSLVILRRLHEAGFITRAEMWSAYRGEVARLDALAAQRGGGGNFYLSQAVRVSRQFARAVYTSTWEGRSSFTEAFRLLNVSTIKTFEKFGHVVAGDA